MMNLSPSKFVCFCVVLLIGAFFIRMWKLLPMTRFKNFEGKPERENPKRTVSPSGELGLELFHLI